MFAEIINMYGAEILGTLLLALAAALTVLAEMLQEKKIQATELEMKVLIEAAVAEFNEAFKQPTNAEDTAKATYRVPEEADAAT
ncbi:MAG: hypothetical protein IJZ56_03195 [Oscillospiraceae bacterium]|nr:hypothetical protein [Oscillospiraceae bacterium]